MDAVRKSFRIAELAQRHALSVAFIYNEIKAKRLRARKAGAATIVTDEDEAAWLAAMPVIGGTAGDDVADAEALANHDANTT
jgi:hypothetical protein